MRSNRRIIASALAAAVFVLGVTGDGARAQPVDTPPFEVLVTPYLWLPWTSVGIRPNNPALPGPTDTIDQGQLFDHLSLIPFTGTAELRKSSFGVVLDYMHVPVRAGINTRGIIFGGATAGFTEDVGTAVFFYRPYADPMQYLDLGVGVRAWGLSGDVSLNEGLLPAVSVTRGASWADGLAALRYHRELGNGFGATLYGDLGAGGADLDWQGMATLDYRLRSSIDLHAGFRALGFDHTDPIAKFTVSSYGPILSVTFHFGPS
jgi:hypothetical protein